jgi:2-succinyl-5-enolpyruvyl-6-hydroxy-3-cyclohexene-1-carboxylate synthase
MWMHLDERSCAYFALGMAKASGRPVAILCSSGTAAVNFAPAVVEAFHSRVPLIVLTADRPPELQELGANQTIQQRDLYGAAVKWSTQLPLPEASEPMLRYVRMVADRGVATAMASPRGPVHLNFPFREPLLPAPYAFDTNPKSLTAVSVASGATDAAPVDLSVAQRPLIVCGPQCDIDSSSLFALAQRLGAPVLADALSGLRCAPSGCDAAIASYDAFLRSTSLCDALRPGIILRFGDPPTSKPLATYLQRHRDVRQVVVTPPGLWPDPDLTASELVSTDASSFCDAAISSLNNVTAPDEQWLGAWRNAELRSQAAIRGVLYDLDSISEPSVVLDLAGMLPDGATVFAGNSMPVRDIDSFFPVPARDVRLLGSRGASGIDGVVSTALGASTTSAEPTVLVIGDLSFYHDMNGLLAAQRFGLNAAIVLINNDGGGIFSFLPQHDGTPEFETLFGTPHGLDFSYVGGLYGVGFQRVGTRAEYRDALAASFAAPGVQVIEVRTEREANLGLHQRIWDEVEKAVSPLAEAVPPPRGERPKQVPFPGREGQG